MIPLLVAQYWKLAVAAILVAAIGVQTYRLNSTKADLKACEAAGALFEANLAAEFAQGVLEGAKQQAAARAILEAARASLEADRIRDAETRVVAANARAARIQRLLSESQRECLQQPLEEAILQEFRQ